MKRSQSVKGTSAPRAEDVRLLLNQQTHLNMRIQQANEKQSSLVRSLEVYQQGKKGLSEKEDQLLRLSTVVDRLCNEVTAGKQELKAWRDRLQVKKLEVRQLEAELKAETVATEQVQREFQAASQRLVQMLREIESKGSLKAQEAIDLEAKEQQLKVKVQHLATQRGDLDRKAALLSAWSPSELSGVSLQESIAQLKAELVVKDTQLHSQMETYQAQQGHLMQLSEALKREFAKVTEQKIEAERQNTELDLHDQQIEAQIHQLETMTEEILAQTHTLRKELDTAQGKKVDAQNKNAQLAQQIALERTVQSELEQQLKEVQAFAEVKSQLLSDTTAVDEDLRRQEVELEDEELSLARQQRELEKRELLLTSRKDMGEELELRLESLMLSEDVYHRRHNKEMDVLGEVLAKLQRREQELDEQLRK